MKKQKNMIVLTDLERIRNDIKSLEQKISDIENSKQTLTVNAYMIHQKKIIDYKKTLQEKYKQLIIEIDLLIVCQKSK